MCVCVTGWGGQEGLTVRGDSEQYSQLLCACRRMWSVSLVWLQKRPPQVGHATCFSCVWLRRCSFSLCLLRTVVLHPAQNTHTCMHAPMYTHTHTHTHTSTHTHTHTHKIQGYFIISSDIKYVAKHLSYHNRQ